MDELRHVYFDLLCDKNTKDNEVLYEVGLEENFGFTRISDEI